ncbi:type IV pilus twitching motility protein PilT [Defluviitalea saccharophila]|uniref:Type IV pilus twitching motility protein PilT n=1 Tax=Defluviitalea saccharophila TaxID=879970 RepID=A0ABZ2Y7M9_9FIRM|nr:type IV pilus twitching motility protein PilT [Candidatus Epulonipiscium sp.]
MDIDKLLAFGSQAKASDIHITVGIPPVFRINGKLKSVDMPKLTPKDTEDIVMQLLKDENKKEAFLRDGEADFSYGVPSIGRFRVNVYRQRGTCAAALRAVAINIPTLEELRMPTVISELARNTRGLVLVTGPTGSGKSTTLAAMIDQINRERACHILTLEDPIEYLHKHNKSIVNQREIGPDTKSYGAALRSALREDPDVILVGEMRDLETISIAITAAETGHFVLSTLHTIGAAQTVDRIIDVFPPHQQEQIRIQLSNVLKGVISQQLLKLKDGNGRTAATEIMVTTSAISNLIREGKSHQIHSMIQTGSKHGMHTMDMSLASLYKRGMIELQDAISYAQDQESIKRLLGMP